MDLVGQDTLTILLIIVEVMMSENKRYVQVFIGFIAVHETIWGRRLSNPRVPGFWVCSKIKVSGNLAQ